jgi:hypothetical protein
MLIALRDTSCTSSALGAGLGVVTVQVIFLGRSLLETLGIARARVGFNRVLQCF